MNKIRINIVLICCALPWMLGLEVQPPAKIPNLITVEELIQRRYTYGAYYIEGYVLDVRPCPPCPRPGLCSPCLPESIVISSTKGSILLLGEKANAVIIFVERASAFQAGGQYRFLIQILNVKTMPTPVNNLKMIYSERIH